MTNKPAIADRPVLILVAAGASSRMGGVKKEYLPMNDGTVLSSAARVFLETLPFSLVLVTYPAADSPADRAQNEARCRKALFTDPYIADAEQKSADGKSGRGVHFLFMPGGETRQKSVLHALEAAAHQTTGANPLVFIHDGARPFVSAQIIRDCEAAARQYGASVPALQPVDTQ